MSRLLLAVCVWSRVVAMLFTMIAGRSVMFMELPGAIRTFEFMAFTGNTRQGNGHKKQGKKFHRRASYPLGAETQPPRRV